MSRGQLRIYLGAARGVGKTYAMLSEGHRRQARGADVVVATIQTRGRAQVAALLTGLPIVPETHAPDELDLAAVLARRPAVALVDELARPAADGAAAHDTAFEHRWQEVLALLDAGIDVITTLNVQEVESLRDVGVDIVGAGQTSTVPDAFLRQAQQIELVDITPEALRRRLAHGNLFAPDEVDAALADYYRPGNLTALREVALLWLADRVDEGLHQYRTEHGIDRTWETRERVVVALSGGPDGDILVRRGARIAGRLHGDLLAVHVSRPDQASITDPADLASQRVLVESLGGSFAQVVGEDVWATVLAFARNENATSLVVGARSQPWLGAVARRRTLASSALAEAAPIEVHLVPRSMPSSRPRRARSSAEGLRRRRVVAFGLAVIGMPLLTAALLPLQGALSLPSDLLIYLVAVVGVALVGGLGPALAGAVCAMLLSNYYFTPPLHTLDVASGEHLLALGVFVGAAVLISSLVNRISRRTRQAVESAAEAQTLSSLSATVLAGRASVPDLMSQVRQTFGVRWVALAGGEPPRREIIEQTGEPPATAGPKQDLESQAVVPVEPGIVLLVQGRPLSASDLRVLRAFGAQVAVALERERLARAAAAAGPALEADRTRTALLRAVSHDLRTPLAAARAAVAGLRTRDVAWTPQMRDELLSTAQVSLERLTRLVENLLDLSRLQADAMSVFPRPIDLDDVLAHGLREVDPGGVLVRLAVPEDLPEVIADAALLERVVVNLVRNALLHAPSATPPLVQAGAVHDRVEIRVVDRGPGVPLAQREQIFAPFQRLGDRDSRPGVGLGLAVARGLTVAMSGTLEAEDTPGGGLTMVVSLPAVLDGPATVPPGSREIADAGVARPARLGTQP
jgi:two-component system sensor histidine kinase KdpD